MIVRHYRREDFLPPEIIDRVVNEDGLTLRVLARVLDPRWAWVVECDGLGIVGIVVVMAAHGVVFPFCIFGTSKAPRSWLLKAIREISAECHSCGYRVFMVYLRKDIKTEKKLAAICQFVTDAGDWREYSQVVGKLDRFMNITERMRAVNE